MFLPFFITSKGINLVVYQTWDKPVRYFESNENPNLKPIFEFFQKNTFTIKSVDPLRFLESKLINVRYTMETVDAASLDKIISYVDTCTLLTFSSLDNLYESSLPEELILAIIRVVSNEL